jgi:hypothetical protein
MAFNGDPSFAPTSRGGKAVPAENGLPWRVTAGGLTHLI